MAQASNSEVVRLLERQVRGLLRQVPAALHGEVEAIHRLRVASRRLRLALRILARKPRGRSVARVRARLRELERSAGRSRDRDVGLQLLRQHGGARAAALVRHLRRARERSCARMAREIRAFGVARLRRQLERLLERRPAGAAKIARRLEGLRAREAGVIVEGLRTARRRFDARELHGVRKHVRRLRHATELGQALFDSAATPDRLVRLQATLGTIHDRCVLAGWLERAPGSARRDRHELGSASGARVARRLRSQARREHRRLLASVSPAFLRELRAALAAGRMPRARPVGR